VVACQIKECNLVAIFASEASVNDGTKRRKRFVSSLAPVKLGRILPGKTSLTGPQRDIPEVDCPHRCGKYQSYHQIALVETQLPPLTAPTAALHCSPPLRPSTATPHRRPPLRSHLGSPLRSPITALHYSPHFYLYSYSVIRPWANLQQPSKNISVAH